MDRITKKMLEGSTEVLNTYTKLNFAIAYGFEGRCELYHKYEPMVHGRTIAYGSTKRELYDLIHAMIDVLSIESQVKPEPYENQTKQELKNKGYYIPEVKTCR